jgi:sedoheptulokinase
MTTGEYKYALGIDIGTSKICIVVFDVDLLRVVATYSAKNTTTVDCGSPTIHHEQDPEGIWRICVSLIKQIPSTLLKIRSISLTGQMHGLLLLDGQHEPKTNLITWRDGRHPKNIRAIDYRVSNGCSIQIGYGASTLLSLKESGLLNQEQCTVCSITSFIMGRLCGDYRVDDSLAASFALYSLKAKDWNKAQIEDLGLDLSLFDPIVPSCTPVAPVKPNIALDLGLPESTIVYAPLGDNQASVLGSTGFLDAGVINIGTGGQISLPAVSLEVSDSIEIRPVCDYGFLQVYSSLCGGWAYVYLKDFCKDLLLQFGMEASDAQIFDMLDVLVEQQEGREDLVVDTRFLGARDNPEKFGSISNINTQNFTIASLASAFIRGIVRELHHPEISNKDIQLIVASGNAVRKSPVMRTFIEEEFRSPCKLPPFVEEACVGSVIACIAHEEGQERIKCFYSDHFNHC